MLHRAFGWLVYASVACLLVYLVGRGNFVVPTVSSWAALALSLTCLLLGFLAVSLSWHRLLHAFGIAASLSECYAATGLTIFGKYIPGKVWALVGRAAYMARDSGRSIVSLSSISVMETVLSLWSGLVLGAIGLFSVSGLRAYGGLVLLAWLSLSFVAFGPPRVHALGERLAGVVLRRPISLPRLEPLAVLRLLPWFFSYWLLWSLGFHAFVVALGPVEVPSATGLALPAATTLGTAAIIVPGGLGVREGLQAAYLEQAGLPPVDALAISVASRLWILFGEAFLFGVGILANRRVRCPSDGA